nr:hypothetical protein [Tanacetum cinerariifolium]
MGITEPRLQNASTMQLLQSQRDAPCEELTDKICWLLTNGKKGIKKRGKLSGTSILLVDVAHGGFQCPLHREITIYLRFVIEGAPHSLLFDISDDLVQVFDRILASQIIYHGLKPVRREGVHVFSPPQLINEIPQQVLPAGDPLRRPVGIHNYVSFGSYTFLHSPSWETSNGRSLLLEASWEVDADGSAFPAPEEPSVPLGFTCFVRSRVSYIVKAIRKNTTEKSGPTLNRKQEKNMARPEIFQKHVE